jgi:HlyD family secretion protein
VISPGEVVMVVVPERDPLTVEVKLSPQDIGQVRVGQPASLRFSAFNQRTTPELDGAVAFVSADVTQDPKTGGSFYTGRISVPDSEFGRLGEVKLVAGMPVEAFVKTSERSMISYLTKPMADQIARAFREK